MYLRPNWHRRFQAALNFLEKLGTPIAKQTLEIIKSGKVVIGSFSNLTRKDYTELHEEYFANRKHRKEKKIYPPTNQFIRSIADQWDGAIYDKRIYINPHIEDVRKIAKVIVHELNHFINDSNNHMETDRDRFIEELRANLAEKVALKPLLRFTPSLLRRKALKIIKVYELDLDETVLTEEVKAKVLKGLR